MRAQANAVEPMAPDADMTEARVSGPRAVSRALDVLMLLADEPRGLGLAELSTRLAVPKSTFLATLRGLCECHYLIHEDGRYRLGTHAYHLASRVVRSWSAPERIRAQVTSLARETRESVGFAIADWGLGQAIYIEAANSKQPVRYVMHAGLRAPLYASAAGRVLLAHSTPTRVDAYLANAHLRQLTERTGADRDTIRRNLDDIRRDGFCASFGEMLKDTAALAVPVLRPDGQNHGALILAAPIDRIRSHFDGFLAAILAAGRQASCAQ